MKKIRRYLFVFLVQVLIFVVLGELICKWYFPILKQERSIHYGSCEMDDELGWVAKADYEFQDSMKTKAGGFYPIDYKSFNAGFRAYGDVKTDKKKILFIGDSFTQSAEVSNDKTFYHHLKDSLDVEVFAFGTAMYGTYQEYLVLDKYLDEIQPDLIIWEFCVNDFIDNYQPLAMKCVYKTNLRRPYYVNGKTEYQISMTWIDQMRRKSNLVYAISSVFKMEPPTYIGERRIGEEGRKFQEFDEAVKVTESILQMARKRVPSQIPILVFNAFHYEPQHNCLAKICEQNNIIFSHDFKSQFFAAPNHNSYLVKDGAHWNEQGHDKVAKVLVKEIENLLK